ncbi:MAG: hypothetical protein AB1488_08850 [Nitrospirota bacterium]
MDIERVNILGERITKLIDVVKKLKETNTELETKLKTTEEELLKKKKELEKTLQELLHAKKNEAELSELLKERGIIKEKIEGILHRLESLEI